MRVLARAKINWALNVVGKRPDGYHLLDMLLQSVAVCDVLTLTHGRELSLRLSQGARVPEDNENLVLKAAQALKAATGCSQGADILLAKRIPIGAGMGGGSADAAAVLTGLSKLWGLNLTGEELAKIGLSIGADVPFCLEGGLQRARGIGEDLQKLHCLRPFWLVVVQPCRGLGTRKVFSALDIAKIPETSRPDVEAAKAALATGDLPALCSAMGNALQPTSESFRPEIKEAVAALNAQGAAKAMMTGSGSAVYGVFAQALPAAAAHSFLRRRWPVCLLTHTCKSGLVIQEE